MRPQLHGTARQPRCQEHAPPQCRRRSWIAVTCSSRQFYRPVIIAMAIMWVMQPTAHEVIDVIAVRHAFVSAARPMRVRAPGFGRAPRGIGVADLDDVFVDMILVHVMQMTVVEVIDVAMMAHGRVSAARTMLVSVIRMMRLVAEGHGFARQS
jgi:hypothetical protein